MNGRAIIQRARQKPIPDTWHTFEGKKHHFLHEKDTSSNTISPLIVITPEELVEYIDASCPISVIAFAEMKDLRLRIVNKEYADNIRETLIDFVIIYSDNTCNYWGPQSHYDNEEQIIQILIESHIMYKHLHGSLEII